MWTDFYQDVRFGFRMLLKSPGYTAVCFLVLALGIGANTAIFSLVNGVLLRPLPYKGGRELVVLRQQAPRAGIDNMGFSVKEMIDYREQSPMLDAVVEYHTMPFTLLGRGDPERVQTGVVSANFFDVLGVKPFLGRAFMAGEDRPGAEPVLVLSYEYWQHSHGGDRGIVGQKFEMNNKMHTVVGVLPPIPQYPNENEVYMPASACPFRSSERVIANRNARMLRLFGKVKPGVGLETTQASLAAIAGRFERGYSQFYPKNSGFSVIATPLKQELTREARPRLLVLTLTAGVVLLIACANVANLTLARRLRRDRELAVRASLGASRGRLLRQLLTESFLLALAGGAAGLLLAGFGLDLLIGFAARFTPRAREIRIDNAVLCFTLLVSFASSLLFGAAPALPSGDGLLTALREGGRSSAGLRGRRFRSLLVVTQIAASFVLLIGAGLLLRSFLKLEQVDPGFRPEKVLSARLDLPFSRYGAREQARTFFETLLGKVAARPGVASAAVCTLIPLNESPQGAGSFLIEGRVSTDERSQPRADFRIVSPDYFLTMGVPLVTGRVFTASDRPQAAPVVVINRSMGRLFWRNEDPVGKRVSLDDGKTWRTIAGVVADVKEYGLDREAASVMYVPFAQSPTAYTYILVRTSVDPASVSRQLIQSVHEIDPSQPVAAVRTMEQIRSDWLATPRLTTALLGLFASLALLIAIGGISGVMALSVSQRINEIGIRMALGATPASVLVMILRQGLSLVLIGLALGVAGALGLGRLLSALLFRTEPTDPATFLFVSLLFLAAAGAACFLPARRAAAIDPMIALRRD